MQSKFHASRRERLFTGAAVLALILTAAPAAQAADKAGDKETAVSEVVVTGSNIRGVAPVGSPITTVDRDLIVASGAVTTAQLLIQLPQVTNLGISEQSIGQANGSGNQTRGTSINLRGLGAFTTLTIVDGHRVMPQGTSGQSVDPSIVPTIMLQRIDIEADGASATYGSDAITGVVNLIMRRNFEGVEVTALGSVGDHYNTRQFDILYGHKWETGQITFAAQNQYHSHLKGKDRDFYGNDLSGRGGTDFRQANCTPGNVSFTDPVSRIAYSFAVNSAGALTGTGTGAGQLKNLCDPARLGDLLGEQNHSNFAFTYDQSLGDRVNITAEGLVAHRSFSQQAGPGGGTISLPSTNAFYKAPPAGITAPFCAGTSGPTCETVSYNTLGYVPVGDQTGYSNFYQINVGADIKLFGDWKVSPYFTFGRDSDKAINRTGLAGGGAAPGAAALAAGFNPFASTQPAAALNLPNPAQVFTNSLFYAPNGGTLGTANVTLDGALFEIPGGPVRAAVGYQYQDQAAHTFLATGTVQVPVINPVTGFRKFDRHVKSYFGEIDIPLVGKANALPFVQSLEFNLAYRSDSYRDKFKGQTQLNVSTNNPKFGVNWVPFDGMKVRASYGTSFRAPVYAQEFGNSNQLFVQAYPDAHPNANLGLPAGSSINYIAVSGPNPDLVPETAKTRSYGFDYDPSFLPGGHISVTYFDIDYQGAIANFLSNGTILSSTASEAQLAGTGIINRNPTDAFLNSILIFNANGSPTLAVNGPAAANVQFPCWLNTSVGSKSTVSGFTGVTCNNWLSGAAVFIDGRNKNLGVTLARGFDLQARYHWATDHWGDFGVGVNGTYFTKFDQAATPTGTAINIANTVFNPLRFKYRATGDWHMGPVSAVVLVNYQNGYHNAVAPLDIPSWTTLDAHASYNFGDNSSVILKNLTIAVDVTNLFDKDPPFVNIAENPGGGGGGSDPVNSNPIGRMVGLSIDKHF